MRFWRGLQVDRKYIEKILTEYKNGSLDIDGVMERLKDMPYQDLGFARVDHHRSIRKGFPEVIFCPGKRPEQIVEIFKAVMERNDHVLATRASEEVYLSVREQIQGVEYNPAARTITIGLDKVSKKGNVVVATGGTSDIPVAEEAAVTAEMLGSRVERLYDVGVAGIHRLLNNVEKLYRANVIVAVAGMEGALASVIAGLVGKPVIAVPTSVGYGANFGGLSALLTMLNSCASGVSVVNIDNGFGGGYIAAMINRLAVTGSRD
jgi:hypothetical protein